MNILGLFFPSGAEIMFSFISGVYRMFLARIYDIFYDVATQNITEAYQFGDVLKTMYVLGGIFMIFRVTVALIQMIIDPDQVSDNQTGAGKLLTRVATALLLLVALYPGGLIIGEDGILSMLETAIIGDAGGETNNNGLLGRLTSLAGSEAGDETSYSSFTTTSTGTASNESNTGNSEQSTSSTEWIIPKLIDEVYADTTTCYYVYKTQQPDTTDANGVHRHISYVPKNNTTIYEIKFDYDNKTYDIITNNTYNNMTTIKTIDISGLSGMTSGCPKRLAPQGNGSFRAMQNYALDSYGNSNFASCAATGDSANGFGTCQNIGIIGGFEDRSLLENAMRSAETYMEDPNYNGGAPTNVTNSGFDNANEKKPDIEITKGIVFATNTAKSFMTCSADSELTKCDEVANNAFTSTAGGTEFVKSLDKDEIQMDMLTSLICGIAVAIFLLYLVVDLIVRKFKLLLLNMISPIPIISYVDPKSNIFTEWRKMYVATYIDIFIKLIAMKFAINLFPIVWHSIGNTHGLLLKFLYIIAILIFVKWIPTMLNKVFGIDATGGTFGQIGGMLKKGLGFGAGAAVGAAVGGVSAAMTGRGIGGFASSIVRGGLRGAGSGVKGNITGGAKDIAASNMLLKQQKDEGLSWKDRALIGMSNATGIPLSGKRAKEQIDTFNALQQEASKVKSYANDEMKKKGVVFNMMGSDTVYDMDSNISSASGRTVATVGEDINMANEYRNYDNLLKINEDQWNSMEDSDKINLVGAGAYALMGGGQASFAQAVGFQQERLNALESKTRATGILSKDKSRVVTSNGEKINMKQEYLQQQNLSRLTSDKWNSMSTTEKISALGGASQVRLLEQSGGDINDLTSVQMFKNDRVTALEDYANVEFLKQHKADAEVRQIVGGYNDKLADAKDKGLSDELNKYIQNIENNPYLSDSEKADKIRQAEALGMQLDLDSDLFDNKTFSNLKDGSIEVQAMLGEEYEQAMRRARYTNNQ